MAQLVTAKSELLVQFLLKKKKKSIDRQPQVATEACTESLRLHQAKRLGDCRPQRNAPMSIAPFPSSNLLNTQFEKHNMRELLTTLNKILTPLINVSRYLGQSVIPPCKEYPAKADDRPMVLSHCR